ncbi:MAG: response regulator transcription factor [Thermomicrobiales bacterium]|jgi:DNA-binding NarL/FixJ family response regulator
MIRLFLIDDHASFRELLALRLQFEADVAIVGEAGSIQGARELLRHVIGDIDVALVDLDLPDGSGVTLIHELHQGNPEIQVVVLTASGDRRRHADAIAAGAVGVLLKDAPAAEIVAAVRKVSAGESILSPRDAIELLRLNDQQRLSEREVTAVTDRLSPRELDILQLLAEGLGDEEIAERLFVSPKTVRNQMVSILNKLGVDSRLQALVAAVRYGIVAIK